MRGEVEIWDGDKLLHKESNLLVNGAGELLADIMTVSPSLSGITDHATSSILDSSNYTIQAISFGKDASAYQYNAHKYGDRRNLFYDSTYSSIGEGNRNNGCWANPDSFLVSSVPSESNPPGFEDIPSSVAHVTMLADLSALDDGGTGGNCSFSYGLNFRNSNSSQTGPYSVSALQDKWFCTSVYIKAPVLTHPYNLNIIDGSVSPNQAKVEFKNTIDSPGSYAADPSYSVGRSRNSVNIFWDPTTDPHTPSSINVSTFQSDPRTVAAGFTEDLWNANGGVQDVGNGWYRMWNATPAPSGADNYACALHAAGWDHGDNYGETSGGLFTFGWQVEVGKWPTPLQINSGYQANGWDLSGSVLNQWYDTYGGDHPLDKGTVRVLNEPIPNPNLLFYTDDPGGAPGLSWVAPTDKSGDYWTQNGTNYVWSFSSISTQTDPFGGTNVTELSSVDVTLTASLPMLDTIPISGITSLSARDTLTWKEGYDTTLSWYVKKPSSNAVSSFALRLYDRGGPPPGENSSNKIEWEWTGTVPRWKTYGQDFLTYGQESVGNDWYRMHLTVSGFGHGSPDNGGETVEGDPMQVYILMGTDSPVPGPERQAATSAKRIWLSSPQVEQWPIGTKNTPTKYRAVAGNVPTSSEDNLLTSSYTPTNYLSSPPNPESTRVEDNNTTVETFSGIFSSIDFGQNLNMVPWRDYSGMQTQLRTPTSFSAYAEIDSVPPKTIYVKDYYWPFKGNAQTYDYNLDLYTSGVGTLGNQAYYLGCYPEGSSTGGSNWALVSSLDNSAAYLQVANGTDSNFVSGTYNSIVNEASSMDAFGFVGKVYDAKQVVGELPNPNLLAYTINTEDDPNLTFNSDLAGTWDSMFVGELGTFSSVAYTNPFGGPSSMILSGAADAVQARGAIRQRWDGSHPNLRLPLFTSTSSICFSTYIKEYDDSDKACSSFMINVYDETSPDLVSYVARYKFVSKVPTLLAALLPGTISKVEDVGDDWYRVSVTVDGLPDSDTAAGDHMEPILYLSDDQADVEGNVRNKLLYWYAPQVEQHPTAYGITLPTPYQAVAGLTPTVAEQTGEGGLHVSGGIDATNSGTVEYSMIVGSGDVGYSNLYGGIYNMGLWTIDMDESIKAGNTPPYSFGPLNNPRKYKLFATKHLTKNLGYIEDNGTNAGSLNYSDLTIKWRLHFH
jgi:hypothetical protein